MELDPRFAAGVKLLERTGARQFRVGHSHEDDGEPIVWYATAKWLVGLDGLPRAKGSPSDPVVPAHHAAGAMHPMLAVMRLCDDVITGGSCVHCYRPTIFDENPSDTPFDALLNAMGCVYAWDPELQTFRRSCEGDAP